MKRWKDERNNQKKESGSGVVLQVWEIDILECRLRDAMNEKKWNIWGYGKRQRKTKRKIEKGKCQVIDWREMWIEENRVFLCFWLNRFWICENLNSLSVDWEFGWRIWISLGKAFETFLTNFIEEGLIRIFDSSLIPSDVDIFLSEMNERYFSSECWLSQDDTLTDEFETISVWFSHRIHGGCFHPCISTAVSLWAEDDINTARTFSSIKEQNVKNEYCNPD
jgi:hypothetical protein